MAQEETNVKVTYDDLKPFIVEVGKKIHAMLVEARIKHGERYNNKNRYEEMYKRFGNPQRDPERFYDEYVLIMRKKSELPASVRYTVESIMQTAFGWLSASLTMKEQEVHEEKEDGV